jgi:hypothetical protein
MIQCVWTRGNKILEGMRERIIVNTWWKKKVLVIKLETVKMHDLEIWPKLSVPHGNIEYYR